MKAGFHWFVSKLLILHWLLGMQLSSRDNGSATTALQCLCRDRTSGAPDIAQGDTDAWGRSHAWNTGTPSSRRVVCSSVVRWLVVYNSVRLCRGSPVTILLSHRVHVCQCIISESSKEIKSQVTIQTLFYSFSCDSKHVIHGCLGMCNILCMVIKVIRKTISTVS